MQSANLLLSLVQTDIFWEQKEKNLTIYEEKISSLSGNTYVVVLPEFFATGFSMNAQLAEPMDGKTVSWMKLMAFKYGLSIAGSAFIKENGTCYNRLVWVKPDGTILKYNKRHLFSLGEEHKIMDKGDSKLIVEYDQWKICPMICYDLRFPIWIRNKELYDVLIFVANWPDTRQNAWTNLLISRAIENQCYCIGVNRIGEDGNGLKYCGGSVMVDPTGEIIGSLGDNEGVLTKSIDRNIILETRSKLPFLKDADKFTLDD